MKPIEIAKLCHIAIDLASDAMHSPQWAENESPFTAASLAVALAGPDGCMVSASELREAGIYVPDVGISLDISELVGVAGMMIYATQFGATVRPK